jgi:hypothetical protein
MGHIKRDGSRRRTDVQHGHIPLHFVMAGLMKEVAESHHASGFTREVHGKSWSAATEHTRHWIQFLAAVAQVVPGHDEVGRAESSARGKQQAILPIPKATMGPRFRQAGRLRPRDQGTGRHRGRLWHLGKKKLGCEFLRQRRSAQAHHCRQNYRLMVENGAKLIDPHNR